MIAILRQVDEVESDGVYIGITIKCFDDGHPGAVLAVVGVKVVV